MNAFVLGNAAVVLTGITALVGRIGNVAVVSTGISALVGFHILLRPLHGTGFNRNQCRQFGFVLSATHTIAFALILLRLSVFALTFSGLEVVSALLTDGIGSVTDA
jgi:uncharacterized membrane protein